MAQGRQDPEETTQSSKGRSTLLLVTAAVGILAVVGVVGAIALTGDEQPSTITDPTLPPTTLPTTSTVPPDEPLGQSTGTVDFSWTSSVLPLPDAQSTRIVGMGINDGTYLVFGHNRSPDFPAAEAASGLLLWESQDGESWDLSGTVVDLPPTTEIYQVVTHGGGFVLTGMTTDPELPRRMLPLVYQSIDGRNWARVALSIDMADDQQMYLQETVAGPSGLLLSASLESSPPEPVVVIEKEGKTVTLDPNQWTVTVADSETGAVLISGTPERFFGFGSEFGPTVWDPDTGDPLFVIGWERFEADPDEVTEDGSRVFYEDDYRLVIDRFSERYAVEDATTGELLFEGQVEDLFRGPAPTFVDDDGNEILSLTWAEVDRASELAWDDFEYPEDEYHREPALFYSADGATWSPAELGDFSRTREVSLMGMASTAGGFVVLGELWNPGSPEARQTVWRSSDGADWTSFLPEERLPYLHSMSARGDVLFAIGEEGEGMASVFTSSDGLDWELVLQTEQSPQGYLFFSQLATGDLGVLVIGEREGGAGPDEMQIFEMEADGFSLVVEGDFVFIIDTETHEVIVEGVYWELEENGLAQVEGDLVQFYSHDGALLLEAPASEVLVVVESFDPEQGHFDEYSFITVAYFSSDGTSFSEIDTSDALSGLQVEQALVGSEVVLLAGREQIPDGEVGDDEASAAGGALGSILASLNGVVDVGPQRLVVLVGVPSG